jgi:hypothetical protein
MMKSWLSFVSLRWVFVVSLAYLAVGQITIGQMGGIPTERQIGETVYFPHVTGTNLEGRTFNLPEDFEADLNLVAIAFYGNHQFLVNTWLPAVTRLTSKYNTLKFYELPTLSEENGLAQAFINGGMRAGIPDPATRAITITLYLDRAAFLKAIGETSDSTIYTLLVNRQGEILWRGQGAYTQEQEKSLEKVLVVQ